MPKKYIQHTKEMWNPRCQSARATSLVDMRANFPSISGWDESCSGSPSACLERSNTIYIQSRFTKAMKHKRLKLHKKSYMDIYQTNSLKITLKMEEEGVKHDLKRSILQSRGTLFIATSCLYAILSHLKRCNSTHETWKGSTQSEQSKNASCCSQFFV